MWPDGEGPAQYANRRHNRQIRIRVTLHNEGSASAPFIWTRLTAGLCLDPSGPKARPTGQGHATAGEA